MTKPENGYRELHQEFENREGESAPRWLREIRAKGIARFEELGLPDGQNEEWRFTSLSAIREESFALAPGEAAEVPRAEIERLAFPGLTGPTLVFVDGVFAAGLSSLDDVPLGVTVLPLGRAIREHADLVEPHLDRLARGREEAFTSLNSAFAHDGVFVHVPTGVVVPGAIHAIFFSTSGERTVMTHPRNLILVEREAQVDVIEDYASIGERPALTNAVSEVVIGENAHARHYVIERENSASWAVTTVHAEQARDSRFSSHSALVGGSIVRNNVYPVLNGEGCDSLLNGFYVPCGTQHHDTFMVVRHAQPHCDSRQFYRGILDDESRGVFSGRIIVHEGAQKTDAKQTNMNLLLSDEAMIDTKPQLEIYADDVKCTHGATVGQIDPDAIFYLRARGIPEKTAKGLLVFAFANEVIDRMELEPVRRGLRSIVAERLPGVDATESGA